LEQLRIAGAERLLFFKHEERPVLVQPSKLVLGRTQHDELNRGFSKLNVAFTLPPGSYATLVVKRLFHRTAREDTAEEIQASSAGGRPEPRTEGPGGPPERLPTPRKPRLGAEREATSPPSEKTRSLRPGSEGFRARAKARKDAKAAARERQKLR